MTIVAVCPEPSPPLTPAEVAAIENSPSAHGAERVKHSISPVGRAASGPETSP